MVLTEALVLGDKNTERCSEAELYRLKGKLTLHQDDVLTAGVFQVEGTGIQPCTHTSRIVRAGARIAKEGQARRGCNIDFTYASDKDLSRLP